MPFLPGFKNDIFISYARVDDKIPGRGEGWVELFHDHLATELAKCFGRFDEITIWRDKRKIGGNTFFDEEIQSSINESGIFLALTSTSYLHPQSYCPKELRWFCQKAKAETPGIKVGTHSRLFNLLLQNIPREEWPDDFTGTGGFAFHDARDAEELGATLLPGSEAFEAPFRQLVAEIVTTLKKFGKALKPAAAPEPPGPQEPPFTIFLAHAEGPLRTLRKRVAEELRQNRLDVVTEVPPPYEADDHEQRVVGEIGKADLSVHLLDDSPGADVVGLEGVSYYQKQVEIGRQHARSQMIWVPQPFDIQAIEDENHKKFLDQVVNGQRQQSAYSLIEGPRALLTREILDKVQALKQGSAASPSAAGLLDSHPKDQAHAFKLSQVLIKRQMAAYMNPEADDPQQHDALFQQILQLVSVLIIVYGKVDNDWVRQRIQYASKLTTVGKCSLKLCAVYLAPVDGPTPPRERDIGIFPAPFLIYLFKKPETLATLLDSL